MTLKSLDLLPELLRLPTSHAAQGLDFRGIVTCLRELGKDHFAVELSEGVDETIEALISAVPNVPDELSKAYSLLYPNSEAQLHEHYQDMVERGERSVTGFVSHLKGKVAEIKAEDLLEERFPDSDFRIAVNLNQPVWDLQDVTSDGQEILAQVKMGGEGYVQDVLERMHEGTSVLFATSTEIYKAVLQSSPELSDQLINLGISNADVTEGVEEGLSLLAANSGFDVPDSLGEMLPYVGEIILGIRLILDVVSTERDFKDVNLDDRARVHALKALVLMSKFGVTTVFTTTGGAGGTAVGTALFPGVGSAAGGIAGGIAGAGVAALLNRRIQPHMMEMGMAVSGVDEDDMFYFRNKSGIDGIGLSLASTKVG